MLPKAWLKLVCVAACLVSIESVSGQIHKKRWWFSSLNLFKCQFEGNFYNIGETAVSYSPLFNTCYVSRCKFNRKMEIDRVLSNEECPYYVQTTPTTTSTPPPPTSPPSSTTPTSSSTTPPTTTPSGCFYNGKHYNKGVTISSGQEGTWCYSTMCSEDGQIIHGDDFECSTTTTSSTTSPSTPTSSTTSPSTPTSSTTSPSTPTSTTSPTTPDETERQLLSRLLDLLKQQQKRR